MSSKKQNVEVNDRRIKPIYDSLDNNENKRALQEADKLLKKDANNLTAKALKSLALVRLSRKAEAKALLEEFKSKGDFDENCIHALYAVYKEMHNYQEIVHLYERQTEKKKNEENMVILLMAYLRVEDYANMQKTAIFLHKLNPKNNKYTFWNVTCYLLQASKTPSNALFLKMADSWMNECKKKGNIKTFSEIMLYLMVLEKNDKLPEASKVLMGSLGDVLQKEDEVKYMSVLTDMLGKLKYWKTLLKCGLQYALKEPDDFLLLELMIYAVHNEWLSSADVTSSHLPGKMYEEVEDAVRRAMTSPEEKFDLEEPCTSFSGLISFIGHLIFRTKGEAQGRGSRLALLHVVAVMKHLFAPRLYNEDKKSFEDDVAAEDVAQWDEILGPLLLDLIVSYVGEYGTKPCCYNDIRRYLNIVPSSLVIKMLRSIRKVLGFTDKRTDIHAITDEKSVNKHILICTVHQHCFYTCPFYRTYEPCSPADDECEDSSHLLQYYTHALKFGSQLKVTEIQPADKYLLLRSHQLLCNYRKTGDIVSLLEAMVEMQTALKHSAYSHYLKITLIMIHSLLGETEKRNSILESMDIRLIQYDSVGYLLSNGLQLNGDFETAEEFHTNALKFYQSSSHEMFMFVSQCLKTGNYHKVEELLAFKERLSFSIQAIHSSISRSLFAILFSLHRCDILREHFMDESVSNYLDIPLKDVFNNRDHEVTCILFNGDIKVYKDEAIREEYYWLLIESRVLSLLSSIVSLTKKAIEISSDEVLGELLATHAFHEEESEDFDLKWCLLFNTSNPLKDFRNIASSASKFLKKSKYISMFPTPLSLFIAQDLHKSYFQSNHLHQCILNVIQNHELDDKLKRIRLKDLHINAIMKTLMMNDQWFLDDLENNRVLNLLLQHAAHLLLVLQCCVHLLTPFKQRKSKRKNKLPQLKAASYNLDMHLYALSSLLVVMHQRFDASYNPEHHVAHAKLIQQVEKFGREKSDSIKTEIDLVIKNNMHLRSKACFLITKWNSCVHAMSNPKFIPNDDDDVDLVEMKNLCIVDK